MIYSYLVSRISTILIVAIFSLFYISSTFAAPFTISVTSSILTTTTDPLLPGSMTGALYANAWFLWANPIDLRATVLSFSIDGSTGTVIFAKTGDDPSVRVTSGQARVRWEVFQAGTNNPAVWDVDFTISDIDAYSIQNLGWTIGVVNIIPVYPIESVSADLTGLYSYSINNPTNMSFANDGTKVTAANLLSNQNGEPQSNVKYSWKNVSKWELWYNVAPTPLWPISYDQLPYDGIIDGTFTLTNFGQRFFNNDADGDLIFVSEILYGIPQIDLDGNDSTASWKNYLGTFTEWGSWVSLVDIDTLIIHASSPTLSWAIIKLTNAQSGDILSFVSLPVGMSGSYDPIMGILTLSGSATLADYETAIKNIQFSNVSNNPNLSDRIIEITLSDGVNKSDTATSTIQIVPFNDSPIAWADSFSTSQNTVSFALDLLWNDTDPENSTLTIFSIGWTALTLWISQSISVTNGTVEVSTGWVITFSPLSGYVWPINFPYTIQDVWWKQSTANITGTVNPPGPTVLPDFGTWVFNSTGIIINILLNDRANGTWNTLSWATTDLDPAVGIQTSLTIASGTFTLNPITGIVTFVPLTGFVWSVSIPYNISDSLWQVSSSTITATILPTLLIVNADTTDLVVGYTWILSLISNDLLWWSPATLTGTIVSLTWTLTITGAMIDPLKKNLIIPNTTPVWSYTIFYTLCEAINITNCNTQTITITVNMPSPIISNVSWGGWGGSSSSTILTTVNTPTISLSLTGNTTSHGIKIKDIPKILPKTPQKITVTKKSLDQNSISADKVARDQAMILGFILPKKLFDTGWIPVAEYIIDKIRANGIKILPQKGILTTPTIYANPWEWSLDSAPKNIDYWIENLPNQDKNASRYIVIPTLGTVVPVVNISEKEKAFKLLVSGKEARVMSYFDNGALQYPRTANPGKYGNMVVAWHSSYYSWSKWRYNTVFGTLPSISVDDGSEVWVYEKNSNGLYDLYRYKVIESYNTKPTDVSILNPRYWKKEITLYTCTPIGGIKGRWIIRAELIDY